MAFEQTLISAAVLLVLLASAGGTIATVKQCYRSIGAESPLVSICNHDEAKLTAIALHVHYPNARLLILAPYSDAFACVSMAGKSFLLPGSFLSKPQIRGCILKTYGKLCAQNRDDFDCVECTSDNCNLA